MRRHDTHAGNKVLVAYASKHGSTAALAEAVAKGLEERGLDVDLVQAGRVRSLEPYRAVVVGSAVYMGRWRPEAKRLLRRHRRALTERDLWLFSSGPVGEQPAGLDDPKAARWLRPPKVTALGEALGAHDHAVFGGSVTDEGGFMRRKMAQGTPDELRDLRDWDEVRAWAGKVADALTSAPTGA
ncbi:MAG: flavodoxin domain-containing protein [Acidimicrobiia bacterium]|jgi:menaquinone-dependent protoporphyrinogen oxidase